MADLQSLSVVQKLDEIINTLDGTTDPNISAFAAQFEDLKHEPTKYQIGIFGPSGHGKTSLIEALVDEPDLLPKSCYRSSTSVIGKILWNDKQDSQYRSQIQFLSQKQWRDQLERWLDDLAQATDEASPACSRQEEPAAIAFTNLKTVYPYITKENMASYGIDRLLHDDLVQNVLGTTIEFESETATQLRDETKVFIDANDKQGLWASGTDAAPSPTKHAYWPLIAEVNTYLRAPALKTGCVLVDLPGMRDSNAARDKLAEEYIQRCHEVWIVADINRAEDDSVTNLLTNLLCERLKRQLYIDGSLRCVRFICTKTDIIAVNTARENFKAHLYFTAATNGLEQKRTAANRRLEKVNARVEDLNDQLDAMKWHAQKKRKHNDILKASSKKSRSALSPSLAFTINVENTEATPQYTCLQQSSLLTAGRPNRFGLSEGSEDQLMREKFDLQNETLQIEGELTDLDQHEWLACVSTRNVVSSQNIQTAFLTALEDLYRPSNTAATVNRPTQLLEGKHVPVHCVSSQEFREFNKAHRGGFHFPDVADTGIPSLVEHVRETGRVNADQQWLTFTNEVSRIRTSLWLYLKSSETKKAGSARFDKTMSTRRLKKFIQDLKSNIARLNSNITGSVNSRLRSQISYAESASCKDAVHLVQRWQTGLKWNTFKAIMTRDVVWSTKKCSHDLNADLACPFLQYLADWPRTFTETIPSHLDLALRGCEEISAQFNDSLARDGRLYKLDSGTVTSLQTQVTRLCHSLATLCGQTKSRMQSRQRFINRQPRIIIQKGLKTTYRSGATQSGPGTFLRMKSILSAGIRMNKTSIYGKIRSEVDSALVDMLDEEKNHWKTGIEDACDRLAQDHNLVFAHETCRFTATRNISRDKRVIRLLDELDALLREARVNPEDEEPRAVSNLICLNEPNVARSPPTVAAASRSTSPEKVAFKVESDSDEESEY